VTRTAGEPDVAHIASLIGDRARAKVLMALIDGRSLPASVLASEAGVAASTVSEHLGRLLDAGLVTAQRQGRARYFRLAGPGVAELLEAIARIAPAQPVRSLRQGTRANALRRARTCYNHLAGQLGVALMTAMVDDALLAGGGGGGDGTHRPAQAAADRLSAPGRDLSYRLTPRGEEVLDRFGLDLDSVLRHRPAIRYCVDWSEQQHHLAGPLGTAVTDRLFERAWIRRGDRRRALTVTDAGRRGLRDTFGVAL